MTETGVDSQVVKILQDFPTTLVSLSNESGKRKINLTDPEKDVSFPVQESRQAENWDVRMRHHEFRGNPTYSRILAFDSLERCLDFVYDALVVLETLEDHNGE